ncbi:hypothetical protein KPH14_007792 [Odynerus spinipes]|uniref:Lipocalin/cytosolic fatty-acid binding domain-containing protein n=1 Tax=Odynerus spinipes TaxID=1348599 RepID=A0AAD9VL23_9HYME|nr:hypothetical protein KPH14_007792 [Odynerus spinipes]
MCKFTSAKDLLPRNRCMRADRRVRSDLYECYILRDHTCRVAMLRLSIILFLATTAMAQVPGLGACPKVQYMTNFEAQKYTGLWYEVERYFAVFELGGKCVTANYSLNDNGTVTVVNSQISYITGTPSSIDGVARFEGKPKDAKLLVTFPSLLISFDAPYWILETDYDNYAVVWSCTNIGLVSAKFAWLLTREPSPSLAVMEKAYAVLDRNGISRAYFIRTDQKNCPGRN